jgi:hypothetical protein
MVYNTLSYWLSGLYLLSGILNTREHSVSGKGKTEIQLLDSSSETLCFLVFRILDDG